MNESFDQTDNRIYDFVKFILSDVLSKMTLVTTTMNDNSNHIKNLTSIISMPPSRADILDKLGVIRIAISDEIDDEIVKRLIEREKDYINMNNFIHDLNQVTTKLSSQIEDVSKSITALNTKVNIALQVVGAIVVLIPIIWGIFEFVNKVSIHK